MDLAVKERVQTLDKVNVRAGIIDFEKKFREFDGSVEGKELDKLCPLIHKFVEGAYIREIFVPKGTLLVTKTHKVQHPYFAMKGDCSVLTEEGVVRIKAPYSGITQAGTKRIVYAHEDTVWVTVHVTKHKDLDQIEDEVISKNFEEVEVTEKDLLKLKGA